MAQQIIVDTGRREAEARAAEIRALVPGQIVQGITGTIERVLYAAQQQKAQEKERKLALMGTMVSKYGFDALGPDFATEWEGATGIKFPRGPEGKPLVPQTFKEQIEKEVKPIVLQRLKEDPNTALVQAGFMKPPPSPEEQKFKSRELDIKEQANRVREKNGGLRYAAALAKASKDDMPSGWIHNKQSGEMDFVGFEKPSISNKQLANLDKVVKFNATKLDKEYKQSQIDLARMKIQSDDPISGMIRTLAPRYSKLTAVDKKTFDALVATWAETNGIVLPAKPQSWKEWVFGGPTTAAAVSGPVSKSKLATTQPRNPITGMGDVELKKLLQDRLSQGMNPLDIIEQSGNDMRAVRMLSEMAPVQ